MLGAAGDLWPGSRYDMYRGSGEEATYILSGDGLSTLLVVVQYPRMNANGREFGGGTGGPPVSVYSRGSSVLRPRGKSESDLRRQAGRRPGASEARADTPAGASRTGGRVADT